ncbi:MAG: hypothetical protein ACKVTZ_21095 [Bacteroidia bacterium]
MKKVIYLLAFGFLALSAQGLYAQVYKYSFVGAKKATTAVVNFNENTVMYKAGSGTTSIEFVSKDAKSGTRYKEYSEGQATGTFYFYGKDFATGKFVRESDGKSFNLKKVETIQK